MSRTVSRSIGLALNTLHAVAPGLAGRLAYDLFCTPPSKRLRTPAEVRALETLSTNLTTAQSRRIGTPAGALQVYRWPVAGQPAAPRVLLIHGWTAEARIMTLFVEPLRRAGFEVVAFDLPAHGASGGKRLNMPIGAEATLAVTDACGPFHAIVAHSFGGLVAALALEGGAPLTRAIAVERLVLISTPHSVARLVREFGDGLGFSARLSARLAGEVTRAAGRSIEVISAGDLLRVGARPTLLLQDDDDEIVPAADAMLIAKACGATVHATKGLGHRRIVVMPTSVRTTIRFLKGEAP